jgi:DNA-binding response OmpR family regulator
MVRATVSRILIVDDDPQFRRVLRIGLRSHGYEVSDALDAQEALDSVVASPPDLIVLDWDLPKLDGIKTCRALRANSDVPVIMASGNRPNSKQVALEAGATDFLAKPFSIDALTMRIEASLKLGKGRPIHDSVRLQGHRD